MRGKHGNSTTKRRSEATEIEIRDLKRRLRNEVHEHAVTVRRAEQAERLESVVEKLRLDLEQATSDEVRDLTDRLAECEERLSEVVEYASSLYGNYRKLLDYTLNHFPGQSVDQFQKALEIVGVPNPVVLESSAGSGGKKIGPEGVLRLQRARRQRAQRSEFSG